MKTVIKMAREAGLTVCRDDWVFRAMLERFSEIVRADERARMAEQPAQPLTYCQECMRPNPVDGTACAHSITATKGGAA